jgi:hypothetical protein
MKPDTNDPRLTAYALGELDGAERAAVESQLAGCAASRRAVEEIRQLAASLAEDLRKEPCPALTDLERLTIRTQLQSPQRGWRFAWGPMALAACVLVAIAVYVFQHVGQTPQVAQNGRPAVPPKVVTQPDQTPDAPQKPNFVRRKKAGGAGSAMDDAGDSSEMAVDKGPGDAEKTEPAPEPTPTPETPTPADTAVATAFRPNSTRVDSVDDASWIDQLVESVWEENSIKPSSPATDGEFIRRAYLDIVGHVPPAEKAEAYIRSRERDKKVKLIKELLNSDTYGPYWAGIWSNHLVGRRPGARNVDRDSLQKYLRDSFAENKPWNKLVYELVTATGGSTPESVQAGVPFNGATNFLMAHMNDQAVPATAFTTRLFLGVQVQCTQCHDHPFNDRKQESFWGMNAFFRGLRRQEHNDVNDVGRRRFLFAELTDREPGDDLFVRFDKRNGFVEVTPPRLLDGRKFEEPAPEMNLRQELGKFIVSPKNEYFAQAIVNRMWAHFLGRGIVHPMDDLGEHNPPSNPELLERLAEHFKESNYDLKRLIAWITLSKPYSLSSQTNDSNKEDDQHFSHYPLKQLSPEQMFDSIMVATKADRIGAKSWEDAPRLKDNLLRQFTIAFNNDENAEADTFNGTVPQALFLMNGDLMSRAISMNSGSYLRESVDQILEQQRKSRGKARSGDIELLNDLYLSAVSRYPNQRETKLAAMLLQDTLASSKDKDPIAGYQDIFWALLNSSEFVLNH